MSRASANADDVNDMKHAYLIALGLAVLAAVPTASAMAATSASADTDLCVTGNTLCFCAVGISIPCQDSSGRYCFFAVGLTSGSKIGVGCNPA